MLPSNVFAEAFSQRKRQQPPSPIRILHFFATSKVFPRGYSRCALSPGKVIAPTRWIIAAKFFPHRFVCVIARRPVRRSPEDPTIQN